MEAIEHDETKSKTQVRRIAGDYSVHRHIYEAVVRESFPVFSNVSSGPVDYRLCCAYRQAWELNITLVHILRHQARSSSFAGTKSICRPLATTGRNDSESLDVVLRRLWIPESSAQKSTALVLRLGRQDLATSNDKGLAIIAQRLPPRTA